MVEPKRSSFSLRDSSSKVNQGGHQQQQVPVAQQPQAQQNQQGTVKSVSDFLSKYSDELMDCYVNNQEGAFFDQIKSAFKKPDLRHASGTPALCKYMFRYGVPDYTDPESLNHFIACVRGPSEAYAALIPEPTNADIKKLL